MRTLILSGLLMLGFAGASLAQDVPQRTVTRPSEFYPHERGESQILLVIRQFLDLSEEQMQQVQGLNEEYSQDLAAGMERLKRELEEKYQAAASEVLTEDQAALIAGITQLEETLATTAQEANAEYRKSISTLFEQEEREEADLRRGQMLPQNELQLFDQFAMSDAQLRQKHIPLQSEFVMKRAAVHSGVSKVNWREPGAHRRWQEESSAKIAEIEAEYLEKCLNLLTDDQKQTFTGAVEAQKQWLAATEAAEQGFLEKGEALLGEGADARRLEHRLRMVSPRRPGR